MKEIRNFSYTFWKGIKNKSELIEYVNKVGDCPEGEMFRIKLKGDNNLIKGKGFIEKAHCDFDDEEWEEIPLILKEVLQLKLSDSEVELLYNDFIKSKRHLEGYSQVGMFLDWRDGLLFSKLITEHQAICLSDDYYGD